jgi:hypothetical protein
MSKYIVEVTYRTEITAPGVLVAFDRAEEEMPQGVNPGIMRIISPAEEAGE